MKSPEPNTSQRYTHTVPGREVKVRVNKISKHRFQDNQQSEVVIGGARDGINELTYEIRDLPGYQGDDPHHHTCFI